MSDGTGHDGGDGPGLMARPVKYYKRDFWGEENLKYSTPHFRMRKVARVARRLARNRECDLLDVGCGPNGALGTILPPNIRYHGIDIAIPDPAANLLEMDILAGPIAFRGKKFDLVVAQGLFEYIGKYQSEKFADIADILKPGGRFIATYMNFDHRKQEIYWPYSNTQRPADFRKDLSRFFRIERFFPGSHNWRHDIPARRWVQLPQTHVNINVPVISPVLAVDYLYICSPLQAGQRLDR
jgi:cyclopropane fatty-acyl-phospholipid synthase-like methyltransferase